tara:strand:+ start:245 stop:403 length:159 start_codon:yes stop_codon:yes gene_type:complete
MLVEVLVVPMVVMELQLMVVELLVQMQHTRLEQEAVEVLLDQTELVMVVPVL